MAYFYPGYSSYFWLSLLFMANTAGPLFHTAVPHWPGVFWSLAVEEHFYLVWPRLVRILSRRTLAIVCAALMVFEPVLRAIYAARGVDIYPCPGFGSTPWLRERCWRYGFVPPSHRSGDRFSSQAPTFSL